MIAASVNDLPLHTRNPDDFEGTENLLTLISIRVRAAHTVGSISEKSPDFQPRMLEIGRTTLTFRNWP
ncbi:hypothetical protein NRB20_62700 [Nocardia sp. RB20]|uniref:Uncharacterized protein n=1 Tax=Nocardia macrotermitis TaxID=2585198 RepID=A0A7K0DBH7_9NOCA|nr:hypothetical protein [Nocardia macrotermitis]